MRMAEPIVRDSCVLYEQLGYDQLERLYCEILSNMEQQHRSNIGLKICPVCKVEHMNENKTCSLCGPTNR